MGRIDWTKALLSLEFKPYSVKDDPFEDIVVGLEPSSDLRRRNLGQIMTYAELSFQKQHRTHHYTIVLPLMSGWLSGPLSAPIIYARRKFNISARNLRQAYTVTYIMHLR